VIIAIREQLAGSCNNRAARLSSKSAPPRHLFVLMAAQIPLPLTQASEQSPNIFVDLSGSPLSVYLDVNPEILSRPRLIRLLRVGVLFTSFMHVPKASRSKHLFYRHQVLIYAITPQLPISFSSIRTPNPVASLCTIGAQTHTR
jgi:hypothetical protein